jgi:hypothetical protein
MPDRKPKPERITPHRDKICKTCGRAFPWRQQWAQDWDIIKHCSDACRGHQPGASDAALEAAILSLLDERNPAGTAAETKDKTICPSEAAKAVGGRKSRQAWEGLMEPARAAARRLVTQGKIVITQHGAIVDPATAKGPIRLRLR